MRDSARIAGSSARHRIEPEEAKPDVAKMRPVHRPVVKTGHPERATVARALRNDPPREGRFVAVLHIARAISLKLFGCCSPTPKGLRLTHKLGPPPFLRAPCVVASLIPRPAPLVRVIISLTRERKCEQDGFAGENHAYLASDAAGTDDSCWCLWRARPPPRPSPNVRGGGTGPRLSV